MSRAAAHAAAPRRHDLIRSTGISTGRLAIWWFLGSEVVIFGGLIVCYVLFRLRHPEWGALARHTVRPAGAFNTLVLLTSSLFMVLAHAAVEHGDLKRASRHMLGTIALGGVFLGVKAFEYGHEMSMGFTPVSGLFWSFYYALTGLHALHVTGGLFAILAIRQMVARRSDTHRVELVGIYWHFVDVVWIFLFPLLYLAN
ncbi:MAG TPA: cytochrome c oxidase subunit 3 [Candidatus Binatia bacterium]|nr:cytochrome c oxidase subunit 3 [Candidatus Binatia bacterium]